MRLRSTVILALCSAGVLLAQEQAMVDGRAVRIDANDKLSLAHGRGRDGAMVRADDPDTLTRRRRT